MSKHLSIEEKLNAENELAENIEKIKQLKDQIKLLMYRNNKLRRHIYSRKRSKYNGLYGIDGVCYTLFGKKAIDLDIEEKREYNRLMKAKERANKK